MAIGSGLSESAQRGFDVLDDIVRLADTRGLLVVRVEHPDDALAVAGHIERRAQHVQRRFVRGSHARIESGWRDVACRLGLGTLSHDAEEVGRSIANAAARSSAVVIVPLLAPTSWDQAVARAVSDTCQSALFVALVPRQVEFALSEAAAFDFDTRLSDAGLARFWDAVAESQRGARADLGSLERWLLAARNVDPERNFSEALPPAAHQLLERLELARRAWPVGAVAQLGEVDALELLVSRGFVDVRDGLVVAIAGRGESELPSASTLLELSVALTHSFPTDPWAHARAAELSVMAHDASSAEAAMQRAFELSADAESRVELWRRWGHAVDGVLGDEAGELVVRGAELALQLGDVDVALEWADRASSARPGERAAFILGRAALARGDLVSAEAALGHALRLAKSSERRLAVNVEIAEVRYAAGDVEGAEALVQEILLEASGRARLDAQNLQGKLLLARGLWDDADVHFARVACDAAFSGEQVCEFRARVNRAIALLSRGSADEAQSMLLSVLSDAEQRSDSRTVAFALSNLAVLAIERHDYSEALKLSERAIVLRRKLGDRLGFARVVTNLVELRLRLGLVEAAEQALRFGRQALGPGAPASRLAELSLAAARVHLARGRTLEAERETRAAQRAALHSSDGDKLGECHRLAARVALEDGLVSRADAELARARELANAPFARGEVAVLEAWAARAAGRPAVELASTAVTAARASGDEEIAREAHVLAAEILMGDGREGEAAGHVASAASLRDEVLLNVARELREAYLARPDLLRLSRLERVALDVHAEPVSEEEPQSIAPPRPNRGEVSYTGRHPTVRGLLDSVRRVGRTDATVLIRGESGTGKELVAEGLHNQSSRAQGPLVKVNCAALVESLLLSELFGHEKGAFTGAMARRRGRFERANGGTLFLDEIGDISARTQVALLRVLEEHSIERVGGAQPIPVDVRIVCATNKDLQAMVERGEFREDLYYRLSGITLQVPSLRDRLTDLPLLCDVLLERIARERGEAKQSIAPDALELLSRHRWPGNVRELENALRAASLFSAAGVIESSDFLEHVAALARLAQEPSAYDGPSSAASMPPGPLPETIPPPSAEQAVCSVAYKEVRSGVVSLSDLKRQIERECIARALEETSGNITRAAAVLGMKRPRLSQLVKQYELLSNGEEELS